MRWALSGPVVQVRCTRCKLLLPYLAGSPPRQVRDRPVQLPTASFDGHEGALAEFYDHDVVP